ncbi:hypothetical protein ACRE_042870 [Hapsidospora chrysogenum ATCC 11550]|uniref:Cytochrome b561 domain-containing protein n=1 Tax=Hapsidospora chrysogenum (strain ATCC 11550 / CBS 779.69 / DSM 880 / IAM 14645 / JCM 23072 / IMI 49137) TaxID=857340 RepID=A0A086T6G8_HAPC1|nr:hypothetical protein ACRE_042870 [Hapsidospora chrysogenum ATCC 11550]
MKLVPSVASGIISALYVTTAAAQLSFTPESSDGINIRWAVPEAAATAESGTVYVRLDAPVNYRWVGLGIGTHMLGAEMFLIYQDGEGNVTLSTRIGRNHVMPEYEKRSYVELLEGSGVVEDDRMVANIRCGDCKSLDLNGRTSWVSAWLSGDSLDSTDPAATITFHEQKTILDVDLTQARIRSDQNPFLDLRPGDIGGTRGDNAVFATDVDGRGTRRDGFLIAHGVIMTVVFIALYPLGALLMPVFNQWFLHSISQLIAYILMWIGLALGTIHAKHGNYFGKQTHTRLGLAVVILLGFQPLFGWLQHRHYTRSQARGPVGHIHIWYGRSLMILGIVNGGLGLQLASNTTGPWVIAYAVVAGVLGLAYIGSIIHSMLRRGKRRGQRRKDLGYSVPGGQDGQRRGTDDILSEEVDGWLMARQGGGHAGYEMAPQKQPVSP